MAKANMTVQITGMDMFEHVFSKMSELASALRNLIENERRAYTELEADYQALLSRYENVTTIKIVDAEPILQRWDE